jgi:hypothetical protein
MAFWSDVTSETKDPKRQFRFTLQMTGFGTGIIWFAKKINKPSFTISETPHKYLNHTFYYPGKVEWNTVTATLVDPVSPDVAATVSDLVTLSGYKPPGSPDETSTMSKGKSVGNLGDIVITQIDSDGKFVEKWTLRNAWIKDVKYGDLDYDGDDMSTVDIEFRYDWAVCETQIGSSAGGGSTFFATNGA